MSSAVAEITQELIEAQKVVMDGNATRENRANANKFLEEFKEGSHFCADCGFYIFSNESHPSLRHFGLLLIEHSIKFQWNKMALDQKIFIKESLMQILKDGTQDILTEPHYIKNALAKIVVEIIKREWPQHWPGMLQELYNLSTCGVTQTELVLLILLTIAEDIVVLQNVDVKRRREIYQSLTANLSEIFDFYVHLLQSHVAAYVKLKQSSGRNSNYNMNVHCQLATTIFSTLVQYLDWVPISHVISNQNVLLKIFCDVLEDDVLKYPSVECLLAATGRRGKAEDRKPLLHLFNEGYMTVMFKVARVTNEGPIQEKEYIFLKHLCQVFINLGTLLCNVWGAVTGFKFPPNFSYYIKAMISLTGHPSQVLSSYAISLWVALFRHEKICKEAALHALLPDIVNVISQKLIKVGFPSRCDSPSCAFSRLDFDNDDDFNTFFLKFRNECADVLRLAANLAPQITFDCAAHWLQIQLQKPIDCGDTSESNNGLCNMLSPSYLEWDALSTCLECALVKINLTDTYKSVAEKGIQLLETVLQYKTQDPLILSAKLSCISALFVFLKHDPKILTAVFEHIFNTAVFSLPGQNKSNRSRAVKNVRRHACSCLVKICKFYPNLLLPSFDTLLEFVNQLSVDPEQLSQMEKCTLTEGLILISNQFQNFQKQSEFIKGILAPVSLIWLSEDMQMALSSVDNFLAYIGLDQPPVEPSIDDVHGINRSQITYCVNMIFAVVKRSLYSKDADTIKQEADSPFSSHPALEFVVPFFPHLFRLLRVFNMLWLPNVQSKISPLYAKANDILEIDKHNVLGVTPPCMDGSEIPQPKQPLERMQIFLTAIHDNCYHILRNACINLSYGFYSIPHLAEYLHHSTFSNFFGIPDYRVRPIIRVFMKIFVQCCPQEFCQTTVIPALSTLCPFMYQRLSQKWANLHQYTEEINNDEDTVEVQEVLEEQLHRQLTREYLDLLGCIIQGKKNPCAAVADMMEEDDNYLLTPSASEGMTELGQLIFHINDLYPSIALCILNALYWNDTHASLKASQLCLPVVKQMTSDGNLGLEEAQHILLSVLMGLQQHGQHEANTSLLLSLGLQVYEVMRPIHPNLTSVLQQIPNCSQQDIAIFDDKLLNAGPNRVLPEKKKKELFRTLVSPLIGKCVSKMFQKKVFIKALPPLFCELKPKSPPIEDDLQLYDLFSQKSIYK